MIAMNLGRHVQHDPRSKNFAFQVTKPKKEVDTFWPNQGPVLDQGEVGGCVGWTGADLMNTEFFAAVRNAFNGGRMFDDQDGLRFYELATKSDDIPGFYSPGNPQSQDTGSTGLGLAKALKKIGLITSYTHTFGWDGFVQAMLTQPMALGTLWTKSMFTPDAIGQVHVGPLTNANIRGGHEYSCRGISFSRELLLCRNHWTSQWSPRTNGQKLPGEFWISFDDMRALLAARGDATVLHGAGTS